MNFDKVQGSLPFVTCFLPSFALISLAGSLMLRPVIAALNFILEGSRTRCICFLMAIKNGEALRLSMRPITDACLAAVITRAMNE